MDPKPNEDITPRRGPGAPRGNLNAFKNGSGMLEKAVRGKLKTRAKRIAAAKTATFIEHMGGWESTSDPQRTLAAITGNQCGRYDQSVRAYDKVLREHPKVRDNPAALSKLDSYLRPLEDSIIKNLKEMGWKQVPKEPQSLEDYIAEKYGSKEEDAEGSEADG